MNEAEKKDLLSRYTCLKSELIEVKNDTELSFTDASKWIKIQHQIEAKIELIKELLQ